MPVFLLMSRVGCGFTARVYSSKQLSSVPNSLASLGLVVVDGLERV